MPKSLGATSRRSALPFLIVGIILFFIFSRSIAGWIIDYKWWSEMGQVDAWLRMWFYKSVPELVQWMVLAAVIWIAHARGLKHAGTGLREHPLYARLATLAAFVLALILSVAGVDGWTVARWMGAHAAATQGEWRDPAFGHPLSFYFFDLPLYSELATFAVVTFIAGALVYYVTARAWQLKQRFPELWAQGHIQFDDIKRLGRLETGVLRILLAFGLLAIAVSFWLGRYDMLFADHGELLVGIDYVQQNVSLPLQTAKAIAAVVAALLVLAGQRKLALACVVVLIADIAVPPLVSSLYVRPNELALEKPYIERHIEATRSAYGINQRSRDVAFAARKEAPIDFAANKVMLDNVRLWDWQAFHDTLSQSQPLRPYAYADTDVDRYQINGQMRQVLLAPRELDLNQLGAAKERWVIANTIYTHGYGLALGEANQITASGSPELLIRNAPAEVLTPSLKLTRPEIYYGEASHSPVFVRTTQPEFNYPSGSEDVNTRYEGHGGFPITSMPLRIAAAWALGDWNIVLSDALTSESRMMVKRSVRERLEELAPYITWEADPYMVITDDGHLEWIVDGYTTSSAHPYARPINAGRQEFNYIRNSVKATVDAYQGDVHMYVWDDADPLIQAYAGLFPSLFIPASAMPADLRKHTRAPEFLFRTQAEIYRTYHMRNPESFYNRADLWDLATFSGGQGSTPQVVDPTYLIAQLPGETTPEFLLTIPFTPRNKQNLIGLMATRCDGEHLGEIVFLQLPKQQILPGPLQIEALINQDTTISKDLTLWNQQGSQVLRGQIQILPIGNTFLFVAPIYIQAAQARMPQLEKIVLATGNELIYSNTYPQALAELEARQRGQRPPSGSGAAGQAVTGATVDSGPTEIQSKSASPPDADPRIGTIRGHLDRYRVLVGQGKWSEAGKELEAIQTLVNR